MRIIVKVVRTSKVSLQFLTLSLKVRINFLHLFLAKIPFLADKFLRNELQSISQIMQTSSSADNIFNYFWKLT
jgi:hypothetical protein